MRVIALICALAAFAPAAAPPKPEFVHAVEFPYYQMPRSLWERELVWLKTIGVQTIEFPIPWNWHQLPSGDFDFNGATSPRRDLTAFIRLLRKLGLHAWIRPTPPVPGWLNNGYPEGASADSRAQAAWLKQLERLLAPQTVSHGGPVAYVEGRGLTIDAPAPPAPIVIVSAVDPQALAQSREALLSARSILWKDLEDALYPAGFAPAGAPLLRKGAVSLNGGERSPTFALRRDAALLRTWSGLLSGMHAVPMPKPAAGKWPDGISVVEATSPIGSAVSVTNRNKEIFRDDLRVLDPASKRTLVIPGVAIPPGDSLWLPLHVSIGPNGPCRECSNFSGDEHIVYATAELLSIEFENGILAMEFAAPQPGEVILQLARKPVGPFLAAGKPTEFDWDDKTLRARLRIPAGNAAGNRVRIGIAVEEPETSAFFNDVRRLITGQKNRFSTTYSSEEVANRSRLRLPDGFTATRTVKSPNEIDYEVAVPADAPHGDWANLALEADAMLLGRARVQLFRPVSIRLSEAMRLNIGSQTELVTDPPTVAIEPKAGTNVELSVRNNSPSIQSYRLEPSGDGLEFLPPKLELTVAGVEDRRASFRIFGAAGAAGTRDWRLRVTVLGPVGSPPSATIDMPMRAVLLPRGRTLAWSADMDGDGSPEWILESQHVRAVFSAMDGGRWMEFTWKDSNVNFLPEQGAFASSGPVEVRAQDDRLEFVARNWKRTVRLVDSSLTFDQSTPLPAGGPAAETRANTSLIVARPSPTQTTFTLK